MTLLPPLLMVSSKHDCQLYCLNCNIHSQTCVSKNFFWVTLTYRRSISPIMKSIRDILQNKGHPDDRSHRPLNFASHVLLYPTDNSSFCYEPVSNLFLLQGSQVEAISRSSQQPVADIVYNIRKSLCCVHQACLYEYYSIFPNDSSM